MFFYNLKPFYLIDESILVEFDVETKCNTDWVGLFPLGWTSFESYITFEWVAESLNLPWAANSESRCRALLFHPQYHAREVSDSMLYQFVYVTQQIEVLGQSGPFKFRLNSIADACGKQPLFYAGDLFDVLSLKKENIALQLKCEAEEKTKGLSNLLDSLEKRSKVLIVSEGKQIWVKKLHPNEKQFRETTNNPIKLSSITNFVKKFRTTAERQLLNLANRLTSYFQSPTPPVRLAAIPEEGNVPSQLFDQEKMPNSGSITWNKSENSLDLELKLNQDDYFLDH